MTQYLPAFFVTWLILAAAFYIEHANWKDADFRVRYIIGLGTFCLGLVLFGLLVDSPLLAIAPSFLATSGLVVILLYWNEDTQKERERKTRKSGEVVGMARGLTQELIDKGGFRAESDLDDPSRKN